MLIAQSALAAACDLHAIALVREIDEKGFRLPFVRAVNERADWDRNRQIGAAAPGFIGLAARFTGLAVELAFKAKFDERRKLRRRLEKDAAAAAAVAARRAAFRNVLFTTPRNDTVAAVSGDYADRCFVNELQLAYVNVLPIAARRKLDRAFNQREERVILAHPDVLARIKLGAALTHDDVAREHALTAEALDAQTLGIGVAPVTGRAGALFGRKKLQVELEHSRGSIAKCRKAWQGPVSGRIAQMNVSAIAPTDVTLVLSPLRPAVAAATQAPATLGNLSEAAKPAFEALQASVALPPSSSPGFVLPANGNFLRLFSAVTAIAAERVYPAPVFSFSA
jgi:hypothetical protein